MAHSIVYFVCTIYSAAADGVVRLDLDLLPSRYALIQIAITFISYGRIKKHSTRDQSQASDDCGIIFAAGCAAAYGS